MCHWIFPSMVEEESHRFFVMLGDATTDKFTKSNFMNLAAFAEKSEATEMVLMINRDHPQKGKY
jgi:hypothetical protein